MNKHNDGFRKPLIKMRGLRNPSLGEIIILYDDGILTFYGEI